MPRVEVELQVRAPVEQVWERINDFGSYPTYMRTVESVEELDAPEGRRLTRWRALFKGSILCWTDESIALPDEWRVEFQQVDGDLERFDGTWQLAPISADVTNVTLAVDFEIGIPQLASLLNATAAAAIEENCISMIQDVEEHARPAMRP
jgi:ribosome-associated toxin RatA of RatAB toxin-antitoxin module